MSITLWEARGRVRDVKPNCPGQQADGFINRRIRNAMEKKTWADSLLLSTILLPDAVTAGTVTMTLGSNIVVGNGTGWPVGDDVQTFLANSPIVDLGFNDDIRVASLNGIRQGKWLIIELETPNNMEIVSVTGVFPGDPGAFGAFITKQHDANVTVSSSTLAGRQFATNNYTYTITAVLDDHTLVLDQPWGSATVSGQPYQIVQAYCQITPLTRRLLYCWDPVAGESVGTEKTWDILNIYDPQRQTTGDPQELCSMPAAAGGIMQAECWPRQTVARALNIVTTERWPKLNQDQDLLPPFINPEVFIAGACCDALLTKVIIRDGKPDPYYDPDAAAYWRGEFDTLQDQAEQADEGRYLRALQNYQTQARGSLTNYNWLRAHAVEAWPSGFEG